jgi:hypothetical protein
VLVLLSPLGFAIPDINADLNSDVLVNSVDISELSNCFGQNPQSNSSCAVADVDEDGDVDLNDFSFVSARLGQAYPWVLYPKPKLRITYSEIGPIKLSDLNGDGRHDLVTTTRDYNDDYSYISVLLGNEDGTLQELQRTVLGEYVTGLMTLGDMNGDGQQDVVVTYGDDYDKINSVAVLLGNGDGTFQNPRELALGGEISLILLSDMNGDGRQDVVMTALDHYSGTHSAISVLLGNEDGTLQELQRTALGGYDGSLGGYDGSMALGDMNGDGRQDVVATYWNDNTNNDNTNSFSVSVLVLLGNGDGTLQELQRTALGGHAGLMTLSDMNGDGWQDVVIYDNDNDSDTQTISVLLGNEDGTFQELQRTVLDGYAGSMTLGDMNGDGKQDVVVTYWNNYVAVLLGNGDGTLQELQWATLDGYADSVILGDMNKDGWQGVIVTYRDDNNSVSYASVLLVNEDGMLQEQQRFVLGGEQLVALGDINGDSTSDAVIVGSNGIIILLRNRDGSFQEQQRLIAGDGTHSVVVGDMNGDDMLDVVGDNEILLGNGDGGFQASQSLAANDIMALGDVNGDDHLDVIGSTGLNIIAQLGNGDGSFQQPQHSFSGNTLLSLALGDVNEDGHLDVVGTNGYDVALQLGNGDGGFQQRQLISYPISCGCRFISVALEDVNGDARLDVVSIMYKEWYGSDLLVQLGNSDGSFQAPLYTSFSNGLSLVKLGDLNGDDILDLVIFTTWSNEFQVKLGNGDGSFQESQSFATDFNPVITGTLGDVNGDGTLDIVVISNLGSSEILVLLNNGDGHFQEPQSFFIPEKASSLALGDVNGDGRLDVLSAGGGDITLLLNRSRATAP